MYHIDLKNPILQVQSRLKIYLSRQSQCSEIENIFKCQGSMLSLCVSVWAVMPGDGPVSTAVLWRGAGAALLSGGRRSQLGPWGWASRKTSWQRLPSQAGRGTYKTLLLYGVRNHLIIPNLQSVHLLQLHMSADQCTSTDTYLLTGVYYSREPDRRIGGRSSSSCSWTLNVDPKYFSIKESPL